MDFQEGSGTSDQPILSFWQRYRWPLVLALVSGITCLSSVILIVRSIEVAAPIRFSSDLTEATASGFPAFITVDVEGAVLSPGTYQLPVGSRIEDAIQKAGGLRQSADAETIAKTINRASRVVDGAKVYFPTREETSHINQAELDSSTSSYNNNSLIKSPDGPARNGSVPIMVNVNSASMSELDSLPGIGPVTAQKVISSRPYQTIHELVEKKALSESLFVKLRDRLAL